MFSFRGSFEKQHGRHAQALLKSASHHLYVIHGSVQSQLSQEKSLLLTYQILALNVKTLAADEKYSILIRENFTIPIQIHLSEKQKTFSEFLAPF